MEGVNGVSLAERGTGICDQMQVAGYYDGFYNATFWNRINDVTVDTIYAIAYWVPRRARFDRIAIHLINPGAGGTVARLGIYAAEALCLQSPVGLDNDPGALIEDFGTVPVDGAAGRKELVIDIQLEQGLYWLALLSDGVPDLAVHYKYSNLTSHSDFSWDCIGNVIHAQPYGALPDPFPAGPGRWSAPWREALRFVRWEGV